MVTNQTTNRTRANGVPAFFGHIQLTNGFGTLEYDVTCGIIVKRIEGYVCPACIKAFELGQRIAVVQKFGASTCDVYHYRCLMAKDSGQGHSTPV